MYKNINYSYAIYVDIIKLTIILYLVLQWWWQNIQNCNELLRIFMFRVILVNHHVHFQIMLIYHSECNVSQ